MCPPTRANGIAKERACSKVRWPSAAWDTLSSFAVVDMSCRRTAFNRKLRKYVTGLTPVT